MAASKLKWQLIFGIGNPGPEYRSTYHNVGFLMIEHLHKHPDLSLSLPLLTNTTYMNETGKDVKKALRAHNVKPEHLLVIHDDSDISLGKYKISFDRNSAGHKGIESIMTQLKTKKFWRLRIGIRPADNEKEALEFVLKKIKPAHRKILATVFATATEFLKTETQAK